MQYNVTLINTSNETNVIQVDANDALDAVKLVMSQLTAQNISLDTITSCVATPV